MVQGTRENAAHRIAKNGFGTTATTDAGFYGQGIYFTTKLSYAAYFARSPDSTKLGNERVFLLSLVIPGNAFPVTERHDDINNGYFGKPCKSGYQSHYVIVKHENAGTPPGIPFNFTSDPVSNELVLFQSAQSLPLCILYYKNGEFQPVPDILQTTRIRNEMCAD